MHEQSETIQNEHGKWVNAYGKKLLQAGQPLPRLYDWERSEYDTLDQAVEAAKRRSRLHTFGYDPLNPLP